MRDIEIKNKLTVTRGEGGGGIWGGKGGRVVKEHVLRTHRQSQRGIGGSKVGGGDVCGGWGSGGGKMETTTTKLE